jgi:DNA-binding transcriptional MerR regulator
VTELRRSYTAGEASRASGVPYRTLDSWAKSGFVEPSILEARGSGSLRLYSFHDLVALRVARFMRESGISLLALRRVIAYLRARDPGASLANTFLVTDGSDVYEVCGDVAVSTLLQPNQVALSCVINLGALVDALGHALRAKSWLSA